MENHPHRVEREGMPPGYELVEEYVERHPTPSPEDIAAVLDPDDVPIAQDDPPHLFADETDETDDVAAVTTSGAPATEAPVATGTTGPSAARVAASRVKRRLLRR
ncbi:hypothetical protein B7486_69950 [cyanobacterium TDX16]|nr:hypothetical protein B7486_69950 [cyanobacterium TDX16]